ncbi:MAG: aldo/keto reductase [Bacteroidia bacterium]
MEYRQLGKSDLNVSVIGLGCMSLGYDHTANAQIIHRAIDLGISYFDTADIYQTGFNEETLGKALKGVRQQVMIASKVGNVPRADGSGLDWNPRKSHILESVRSTLRRLNTDYLDVYQLHGGTIDDPIDETISAFEQLQKEGLIRWYGISSIRPNVIREYVSRSHIVSNMMQYSLLDRRPEEESLDLLHEHDISVVVRGAVAKGLLAGKAATAYLGISEKEVRQVQGLLRELVVPGRSVAQAAIRFALSHPAVATLALGASNLTQLEENAAAAKSPALTSDEIDFLRAGAPMEIYELHR